MSPEIQQARLICTLITFHSTSVRALAQKWIVKSVWVGFVCVYVLVSLPCGLSMVTMRTAWLVTSLQQCDIIARQWLILLAHFGCVWKRECSNVWRCCGRRREARQQQQSLSTSTCFILCNKNNYSAFVLGGEQYRKQKQNHRTGQTDIYMSIIEKCWTEL